MKKQAPQINHSSIQLQLASFIGNILDHYDNALFGLLAPFLAPLFFAGKDPITALILTYSMLPLSLISRSLGSLFFGWLGDHRGRATSLFYSLMGMGCITFAIGLIPLAYEIGYWAPMLLMLGKMTQGFLAAGETTGGAIFVLENTSPKLRSWMSSLYDASSIGGILIASALVTLLSTQSQGTIEWGWRILYWLGGGTALFGLYIRSKVRKMPFYSLPTSNGMSWKEILRHHSAPLIRIIIASGFAYMTYSLAFTLMNGFVPLITNLEKSDVMKINSALLVLDMLLLPLFGALSRTWGKEKLMSLAALIGAATAIPLFLVLQGASIAGVIIVRIVIVTVGVAFAASYHAWAMDQVPENARCSMLAIGYAIGSQLIGAPSAAASLWLFKVTGWSFAPGIYFAIVAVAALVAIKQKKPAPIRG